MDPAPSTPELGAMRMVIGALADPGVAEAALRAIQATAATEPRAEFLAGLVRAIEALEEIRLPPVPD